MNNNKAVTIVIVIVVLVLVALGAWLFMANLPQTQTQNNQNQNSQVQTEQNSNQNAPQPTAEEIADQAAVNQELTNIAVNADQSANISANLNTNSKSAAKTYSVNISNFSFNPATLRIKKGDKVVWTNSDSVIHTIKSSSFNSSDLNQGGKFEFTFTSVGSFNYTCGIHSSMTGTIIVE